LKYSRTELPGYALNILLSAFDYASSGKSWVRGGVDKRVNLVYPSGNIELAEKRSGLHKLIETLRYTFAHRYVHRYIPRQFRDAAKSEANLATMQSRSWLTGEFEKHLSEGSWPDSDKSFALEDPNANASKRKRKRDQADFKSRVPTSKQTKVL
jgi:hypothetical protein